MPKQILNIPAKVVGNLGKAIKAGATTAIAPATPHGTWQFVLGALVGAPASSVYSFLYNQSIGKIPMPPALLLGVKLLLPLAPIYFIKKSKVPFGNIMNGALVGVMVAQGLNIFFGLLAGRMPTLTKNNSVKAGDLTLEAPSGSWFDKLF
ncbi:unnamed protein product [marine sediment metagenome]|uniref:Uncharacterized protein n=1 Tax=marine sediment metagenome TaxID=412755 RepID=X1BXI1_9ZZZZ